MSDAGVFEREVSVSEPTVSVQSFSTAPSSTRWKSSESLGGPVGVGDLARASSSLLSSDVVQLSPDIGEEECAARRSRRNSARPSAMQAVT